jgi:hypothetical protein
MEMMGNGSPGPLPPGLQEHVRGYLHVERPPGDMVARIWHRLGRAEEDDDPVLVWVNHQRSWRRTAVGLAIGAAAGAVLAISVGIGARVVSRLSADSATVASYSATDQAGAHQAIEHERPIVQRPAKMPVPRAPDPRQEAVPQTPAKAERPQPQAPRKAPPSALESLKSELDLLEGAQAALAEEKPEKALALLERHAREHPKARLREEREGLRTIALCEAGKPMQGRAEAKLFLRRHATSTLAARVRSACELDSTETRPRGQ